MEYQRYARWSQQSELWSRQLVLRDRGLRWFRGPDRRRVVVPSEPDSTASESNEIDGKVEVTDFEFLRNTNNNSWGVGISEEGLLFGSTANRNPSEFMPMANRYYERVRGWTSSALQGIADTYKFKPITDKVRQVDHHGGYTAAAGHALYTARRYPQAFWNRTAFVAGPTGHLVGVFCAFPGWCWISINQPDELGCQ